MISSSSLRCAAQKLASSASCRCRLLCRPSLQQQECFFSSLPPKKEESDAISNTEEKKKHPQDFVQVQLEPGEWDPDRKDPTFRPPWKNNARIISEEDFANRPRVGFSDEFESMHDAMVILSWIDRKTQEDIYQSYLDMMITMKEKSDTTSHEYVMRVLGQKYNITANRVGAIVQLLHNEDQVRKENPDQKLYHEAQAYADAKIAEHIANAYDAYREQPPGVPFVEDPLGVSGDGDIDRRRSEVVSVDDVLDLDEFMAQTLVREQEEARLAIDERLYKEDVDESTLTVKVSADCHKLIKSHEELKKVDIDSRTDSTKPLPENGQGISKERYKFVAHIINTRDEKAKYTGRGQRKKKKKSKPENTLVEQDGELRVANLAEVKKTSWKPEREVLDFTYGGVKQAWLDRTLNGKVDGWGRIKEVVKEETPIEAAKSEEGENTEEEVVKEETPIEAAKSDEGESAEEEVVKEETPTEAAKSDEDKSAQEGKTQEGKSVEEESTEGGNSSSSDSDSSDSDSSGDEAEGEGGKGPSDDITPDDEKK